jgi:hypothetical protein
VPMIGETPGLPRVCDRLRLKTRASWPCARNSTSVAKETVEEARVNLREAVELFFECASPDEVARWLTNEVYVTQLEVAVG